MGNDWRADRKYQFPSHRSSSEDCGGPGGGGAGGASNRPPQLPSAQGVSVTWLATSAAVQALRNGWCHPDSFICDSVSLYTQGCSCWLGGGGVPPFPKLWALFGYWAGTEKPGMEEWSAPSSRRVQSNWKCRKPRVTFMFPLTAMWNSILQFSLNIEFQLLFMRGLVKVFSICLLQCIISHICTGYRSLLVYKSYFTQRNRTEKYSNFGIAALLLFILKNTASVKSMAGEMYHRSWG